MKGENNMSARNGNERIIGTFYFENEVDITDPCYRKDTWCRINGVKTRPGEYTCRIWTTNTGGCGERVTTIGIYLDDVIPARSEMKEIGSIGVDAGLAGFFSDKPDYNDEEWDAFCNEIRNSECAWINGYGFFSESGFGDGSYEVFTNKNTDGVATALEISFI